LKPIVSGMAQNTLIKFNQTKPRQTGLIQRGFKHGIFS
jgi:hypothetical protein